MRHKRGLVSIADSRVIHVDALNCAGIALANDESLKAVHPGDHRVLRHRCCRLDRLHRALASRALALALCTLRACGLLSPPLHGLFDGCEQLRRCRVCGRNKGVLQQRDGGRALFGVLDETRGNKGLKGVGPVVGLVQRRGRLRGDHEDCPHRMDVCMWRAALGHLDGGDAKRPNVRKTVVSDFLNHFGSHPEWCADHRVALGHRVRELPGDTKVRKLGLALLVEENVASLDIAMDFPLAVEILEALERGLDNRRDFILLECLVPEPNNVGHRASCAVLHDYPEVGALEVAPEVLNNEVVLALLHDADLLHDVLKIRVHQDLLDGDELARGLVQPLVDCTIGSLAELLEDLENLIGIPHEGILIELDSSVVARHSLLSGSGHGPQSREVLNAKNALR
eukprot:m.168529 g.168529  ORF g.168529 m.168529 type:complete len:397 (-) comp9910_c1_seq9:5145-6335(-)